MNTTKSILLCAAAAAVAGCTTAPEGAVAERAKMRTRVTEIVRPALKDGKAQYQADSCWAVVQDAGSGEILCTEAVGGTSGTPWRDAPFEAGNFVLPFLAAKAIENGVATPESSFDVSSETVGGALIRDFAHGRTEMTLPEIVKWSSQRGGARLALALGPGKAEDALLSFGFSLDGSAMENGNPDARRAWSGVGRGVSADGLRTASAFSALANGGTLRDPWIEEEDGRVFFGRTVATEESCKAARELLRGVVRDDGTAKRAAVPGLDVAGKTSTFQIKDGSVYSHRFRSMFAGFFEAGGRTWTVLVVFEIPEQVKLKDAGYVAAPVFAEIASGILGMTTAKRP